MGKSGVGGVCLEDSREEPGTTFQLGRHSGKRRGPKADPRDPKLSELANTSGIVRRHDIDRRAIR